MPNWPRISVVNSMNSILVQFLFSSIPVPYNPLFLQSHCSPPSCPLQSQSTPIPLPLRPPLTTQYLPKSTSSPSQVPPLVPLQHLFNPPPPFQNPSSPSALLYRVVIDNYILELFAWNSKNSLFMIIYFFISTQVHKNSTYIHYTVHKQCTHKYTVNNLSQNLFRTIFNLGTILLF